MRIIAGEHRGRHLEGPPDQGTRPMLDRVREALFSTLAPWIADARVLDLFAGTGSLGLEALSRGARSVRMVESDPRALSLQRRNVDALQLAPRVVSVRADALEPHSWSAPAEPIEYDVVFMDPPYPLVRAADGARRVLEAVRALADESLAADGVLVLHTPPARRVDLDWTGLQAQLREYGNSALWYVGREGAP